MVSVCPKHVKNGLDSLVVPHVYKLDQNQTRKNACKCQFCHLNANYKLDSFTVTQTNNELEKQG
ncbi:hypothetical protein BkAM31D_17910 [Halalkalibacter krulwichiae]|uniref:Uncharacterized protein n=1 Tax=Halalkalibacter krulwichiae TaxID=199441 RepID=A0A1X9MDQ3_9BACI|nr:hypothetical protein BkAM31D_17910 [Halalkalibacter krulwichiae]